MTKKKTPKENQEKNPSTKKTSKKTKKPKAKKSTSKIALINRVLFLVLLTLITTIASYFLLLDNHKNKNYEAKKEIKKPVEKKKPSNIEDSVFDQVIESKKVVDEPEKVDAYEEFNEELKKEYIQPDSLDKIDTIIKEVKKKPITIEKKEITKVIQPQTKKTEIIKKPVVQTTTRPKLAIVIDDVTLQSEVNQILDIGYTVTMAFMPPTVNHKHSAKIAQNLPFYMVHFPLEATIKRFEEKNTLLVGDSYETIEKQVKRVREWYPNAIYTNNHTGSVFTSDDTSMDYFIRALKKYNFQFIDSRTTAKSLAPKYTKKYNMPYIARNIFLDNKKDFTYIQNQLKKSINIAKKTGSAIAIGHPYPITSKVLKASKHLLKDLDLVYVNKIPLN